MLLSDFSTLVAVVFLSTTLLKAFSLKGFLLYLDSHSLLKSTSRYFPHILALEGTLGLALLLKISPSFFIPIAITALLAFSYLQFYDKFKMQESSCLCYGSLLHLPFKASIFLNAFYISLLILSYTNPHPSIAWTGTSAGITLCVAYLFFFRATVFLYRNPQLQYSFFKIGSEFKSKWLGLDKNKTLKKASYIFLNCECSNCMDWLQKIRHWTTEKQAKTILVLKKNQCPIEQRENLGLGHLQTITLPSYRFSILVNALPFGIEVEDSVIVHKVEL